LTNGMLVNNPISNFSSLSIPYSCGLTKLLSTL
jgi:hypothetical protein